MNKREVIQKRREKKKKLFVRYLLPQSTEQISIFNRLFQEHYQNVKIFHFYLYDEKKKRRRKKTASTEETVEIKITRFRAHCNTRRWPKQLKFSSICYSICTFVSAMANFHVKTYGGKKIRTKTFKQLQK